MLEVEPAGQYDLMATRNGQNGNKDIIGAT